MSQSVRACDRKKVALRALISRVVRAVLRNASPHREPRPKDIKPRMASVLRSTRASALTLISTVCFSLLGCASQAAAPSAHPTADAKAAKPSAEPAASAHAESAPNDD